MGIIFLDYDIDTTVKVVFGNLTMGKSIRHTIKAKAELAATQNEETNAQIVSRFGAQSTVVSILERWIYGSNGCSIFQGQ